MYFAATNCTGHGVASAIVSVVSVNGLNRVVREFGLRKPGGILDKTWELVIKEFQKSEEEVEEIKADKQSIRKFEWAKPFITHEVNLNVGEINCILCDGYPDQFGGGREKI